MLGRRCGRRRAAAVGRRGVGVGRRRAAGGRGSRRGAAARRDGRRGGARRFSLLGLGLGLLGPLNRPVAIAFPGSVRLLVADLVAGRRPAGAGRPCGPGSAGRRGRRGSWARPGGVADVSAVAASVLPGVAVGPVGPAPVRRDQLPPAGAAGVVRGRPGRAAAAQHVLVLPDERRGAVPAADARRRRPRGPVDGDVRGAVRQRRVHAADGAGGGGGGGRTVTPNGRNVRRPKGQLEPGRPLGVRPHPADAGRRALEDSRSRPLVAAAVASAVPWVVMLAGVAYVEAGLMLLHGAGRGVGVAGGGAGVSPSAFVNPLRRRRRHGGPGVRGEDHGRADAAAGRAGGGRGAVGTVVPRRTLLLGCVGFVVAGAVARRRGWSATWPGPATRSGRSACRRWGRTTSRRPRSSGSGWRTARRRQQQSRAGPRRRPVAGRAGPLAVRVRPAAGRRRPRRPCGGGTGRRGCWWHRDRRARRVVRVHAPAARFLVMLVPLAAVAVGRARLAAGPAVGAWRPRWPSRAGAASPVPLTPWSPPARARRPVRPDRPVAAHQADAPALARRHRPRQAGRPGRRRPGVLLPDPDGPTALPTVFDLPAGVADPVAAWAAPAGGGNSDWLLVINPAEIDRLHDTYRHTPPLPQPWADRGPATFLATGDQAGNAK